MNFGHSSPQNFVTLSLVDVARGEGVTDHEVAVLSCPREGNARIVETEMSQLVCVGGERNDNIIRELRMYSVPGKFCLDCATKVFVVKS